MSILVDPGWFPIPGLNKKTADQLEEYYSKHKYHVQKRQEKDGTWTVLRRKK